eukprot:GEMP01130177.1.p1 GENE.GEMP01130177.1~~GEMP01130177.1.p1  ORF type:complete len:127 (+),score=21.18 GEMP01130177.1:57-437(+)
MRLQHFLNSTLVDFLLTLSPGKAYPLMDLLPTDIEDIAYVIDQVVPATLLRRLEGDPVMDVNWFDMAQSAEGPGYFSSLNVSVNSYITYIFICGFPPNYRADRFFYVGRAKNEYTECIYKLTAISS